MNYDVLFGLASLGLGVGLTLIYQARNAAVKALNEANAAVASVESLSEIGRKQMAVISGHSKAQMDVFSADYDKRIQKIEMRIDDLNSRVAALQIKR